MWIAINNFILCMQNLTIPNLLYGWYFVGSTKFYNYKVQFKIQNNQSQIKSQILILGLGVSKRILEDPRGPKFA